MNINNMIQRIKGHLVHSSSMADLNKAYKVKLRKEKIKRLFENKKPI